MFREKVVEKGTLGTRKMRYLRRKAIYPGGRVQKKNQVPLWEEDHDPRSRS
jgi:hypothetical protein